jgi:pyruvate/2-oxoglutarate dehydrogenase complex dihydrolipoamide dehydrogenase (E3) component
MPTKTLLHPADVLHAARKSAVWGLRPDKVSFDFAKVMARKDAVIAESAAHRQQQLAGGPFTFIRQTVRFVDGHPLVLGDGSRQSADHFIMPHHHPTLAEIWTYPAEELDGRIKARTGR